MLGIASITYKVTHYSFDLSTKSVTSCKRLDLFDNQVGVQRRREARADINKGDASNPVNSEAVVKAEYHTEKPPTPLLDTINFPIHLKNLNIKVITCIQNLPRFVFKNIQVNIPTDDQLLETLEVQVSERKYLYHNHKMFMSGINTSSLYKFCVHRICSNSPMSCGQR